MLASLMGTSFAVFVHADYFVRFHGHPTATRVDILDPRHARTKGRSHSRGESLRPWPRASLDRTIPCLAARAGRRRSGFPPRESAGRPRRSRGPPRRNGPPPDRVLRSRSTREARCRARPASLKRLRYPWGSKRTGLPESPGPGRHPKLLRPTILRRIESSSGRQFLAAWLPACKVSWAMLFSLPRCRLSIPRSCFAICFS